MKPVVCEVRTELPAAPAVVWELLTDWDHLHEWMLELSDLRVTSPEREGVGVEAEARIRVGPITTRDRVRVRVWEPRRRLVVDHLGWVSGFGEMLLTETDEGTTYLVWIESLRPPLGLVGAAGLLLYKPILQRTFERDVRVLHALVRARSGR